MTEKSPGQALDEITAHFAAVNRVRLVVDQLKHMADRMERVAKGLAVSSFDDDVTAEAMLKVAMKGGATASVSDLAQRLAIDTIAKATNVVLGSPAPAFGKEGSGVAPVPVAPKKETGPARDKSPAAVVASTSEASPKASGKQAVDDSFFTEDEILVMNSRHGHHVLHGVELKHSVLQYVRKVLTDARDFVLTSDFSIHANYERMVGSQAFRRKLFEGAVEEYRARTGIAAAGPVSDTPPPQPLVVRKASTDNAATTSSTPAPAVDIAHIPRRSQEVEQLPLGLMPEDAPDFLLSETSSAPKPSDRWEAPFDGVPYSESEEGLRVAEDVQAPSSGSVVDRSDGKDGEPVQKPRVRRGYGFHIGLKGDPFASSDK